MKKIFLTILVCIFFCFGCESEPAKKPVWEQAKFKELARPAKPNTGGEIGTVPIEITVYIFSVPAGNFDFVKGLWPNLSDKPITFAGPEAFKENGFTAAFGQSGAWPPIAEKLRSAEAKNLRTIELIIFDKKPSSVSLISSEREKNIFYQTAEGRINGATLGKGEAMLNIYASALPDIRGVCKMTVEPAFRHKSEPDKTADPGKELAFGSLSFSVKMSPQDFILIGPANYAPNGMTPSALFFCEPDGSVFQMYLIICAGVNN